MPKFDQGIRAEARVRWYSAYAHFAPDRDVF